LPEQRDGICQQLFSAWPCLARRRECRLERIVEFLEVRVKIASQYKRSKSKQVVIRYRLCVSLPVRDGNAVTPKALGL
jgi:hypothetical protein